MSNTRKYYYLKTTHRDPTIKSGFFDVGPLPIVWMYEGFFSLVPKETVANFLNSVADGQKLHKDKRYFLRLLYCDSLSLDSPIGRALAPDEDL